MNESEYIECRDCLYRGCGYDIMPRTARITLKHSSGCGIKTIDAQLRELEMGGK